MKIERTCVTLLLSCAIGAMSACGGVEPEGFALPPGDADAGRAAFVDMACNDCHSIVGEPELREAVVPAMDVPLGGSTTHIRSYDDLVTSIINPSHRISERYRTDEFTEDGQSRMRYYNQVMTVDELVNLVTFLQSKYVLVEYPGRPYLEYRYP